MTLGHQGYDPEQDTDHAHLTPLERQLMVALDEALEFVEDHSDVVDGPEGEQLPNRAMYLAMDLRAVIAKANKGSKQ